MEIPKPLLAHISFFQLWCREKLKCHMSALTKYSNMVNKELMSSCLKSDGGDEKAKTSFVGLFIEESKRSQRGEDLSEDRLRDLVLNFLIAGRDTTAQALSWSIYCLCLHPEVEAKARQEIMDVCGCAHPNYDDLNKFQYLQAVIHETLRLYPSVPLELKFAERDDIWPDATIVPAGTAVFFHIYSIGRDTSIWGEDAFQFKPERWLQMDGLPNNYRYPVFNGGPRECLGRRLAMVEVKTCLAVLLQSVSFKLAVPADEVCTDVQLTLGMGRGLPCFVTARADNIT